MSVISTSLEFASRDAYVAVTNLVRPLIVVTVVPEAISVEPVNSALIAGALGVSKVITDLAKAFLDDGQLTKEEVDAIFKKANKKAEGGK